MKRNLAITYGSEMIPLELTFRPRRELAISVHPDRSVKVVAPASRTVDEVLARVRRKAGWIARQRRHFEKFHPLPKPRRYLNGETHYFLGRQYRLKIRASQKEEVKLLGRFLTVQARMPRDERRVRNLMEGWYRKRAKDVFNACLLRCLTDAPALQMPPPNVVIVRMAKRWGSCTERGNILINLELVKTPLTCIEYLLMHELCHLRVHSHDAAYYRLLTRCMPDWRRRKARLDSFVI